MAVVVRGARNTLISAEKKQHFQRAIELVIGIGADTMRDLVQVFLNKKGVTLAKHLQEPFVSKEMDKYKHLCTETFLVLESPNPSLKQMDVSLLTVLLLHTFPDLISSDIKRHVKGLRDKRNELSHAVKAELENDTLFKESAQMIVGIAKKIGANNTYALELVKTINELRKRELVTSRCNLDIVKINNEMLVVKLVEAGGKETVDKDNTLMIQIGMTKWIRQISRGIDVSVFLHKLKDEGVINDTTKRHIEEEYSAEDQMQVLILHMLNETRFNTCKWCQCLRRMSPCLADLVENTNKDGREIDQYVNDYENESIERVLKETFEEAEESLVTTSSLHILVEERLKLKLDFNTILENVLACFPTAQYTEKDYSVAGLKMKLSALDGEQMSSEENTETKRLSDMSCEDFASYVGDTLSKVKTSLHDPLYTAFLNESISPKAFKEMTKDEMKEIFTPYLEPFKFGIGIQKELSCIQRQIQNENVLFELNSVETLRPFDSPCGNLKYRNKYFVRSQTGNLLIPKHEFRQASSTKLYLRFHIAKEVVKFSAACINGKRNGTIHFGIKPQSNGSGQIIGIPSDSKFIKHLNAEIVRSIETCFKENACTALRCIRPVQVIPVEGDRLVLEVDVVPFTKHVSSNLILIDYPPKGCQRKQCFTYDLSPDCQILPVVEDKVHEVEETYARVFEERKRLEEATDKSGDKKVRLRKSLVKMLTEGNKYVTDEFVPIIVSGKLSGSPSEETIRDHLDVERAFASSKLILDFDNSVQLRKKVEGEKMLFSVKTAEDILSENEISYKNPTWVYCNGNKELSKDRMSIENWLEHRSDGVKNALDIMSKLIPKTRAKVVFLIFQKNITERDPIYEIARMAFVSSFRNQCIVIAENEDNTNELKKELIGTVGEMKINSCFHTGLNWADISQVMNSVCRMNPDVVCKLPHCDGHFVEMTRKEREDLKFTEIDIMSGEECVDEEAKMSDKERRQKQHDAQQRFYRGAPVSSWNFHYGTHVGQRDHFERHKTEIKDKLMGNKGESLIEVHEIEHHPGAGGSTLGRNLLWHFSQFKGTPEKAFRCCAVRGSSITEETIQQIETFRSFKDADGHKPFILLADNKSEDSIIFLKTKLHELAYKTGCPGKLFCLIIIINRMPITHEGTDGKPLLKHKLSVKEQNWFENKYKEMERSDDMDVKTLIAFNFMRKSFDQDYMKTTVESLMQGISKNETNVLKCLALISCFERDHPVPENVFDYMMNEEFDVNSVIGKPWGIAHTMAELQSMTKSRNETWNMHMSDAMDLLITKREDCDFYNSGVCLISQLLARTVLDYIKRNEGLSMESIVDCVLDLVETQRKETNPMSKRFVKIVCSLFKTRQLLESERGDIKEKFSDLVLELEVADEHETENESNQRVLRVMQRCFEITEDAMVGQQLARFNIHIKKFKAAEEAIKKSLEKKPHSSYLLDTYGQIYKSKMEYILDCASQRDGKISDDIAAEVIELAFTAIDKFKQGQDIAVSQEEDTNWGCFQTEVKTALNLLEKFERFECFTSRQEFVSFLNDDSFQVNNSSLLRLMDKCPSLENLRAGTSSQCHLETSLRCLEERNYQVKRELYTIYSENETLLLKLRERFERFYGSRDSTSKFQFTYGIGLKPLMVAKEASEYSLKRRVSEAQSNLERYGHKNADERDLLVYLGNQIITLSSQRIGKGTNECSANEYRRLLSYSNSLVSIQTTNPRSKRIYLETFLYYAMLHWPLKSRTDLDLDVLARPSAYEQILKQWEESYKKNFYIKNVEQHRKYKPKNYFALGKGTPGNDIVDLESIKKEWMNRKKTTGRVRRPVFADYFWKESFVEERLERLEGTVSGSGHVVFHKVQYPLGTHTFKINTYYPCTGLCNRVVTFVLGFTWKGPTAFDVEEKGKTEIKPAQNTNCPSEPVTRNEVHSAQGGNTEAFITEHQINTTAQQTKDFENETQQSKSATDKVTTQDMVASAKPKAYSGGQRQNATSRGQKKNKKRRN